MIDIFIFGDCPPSETPAPTLPSEGVRTAPESPPTLLLIFQFSIVVTTRVVLTPPFWGASGRYGSLGGENHWKILLVLCSNMQFFNIIQHIITNFSFHIPNYNQQKIRLGA